MSRSTGIPRRHRPCRLLIPSLLLVPAGALAQAPDAGEALFQRRCASCHGEDAHGGEFAGGILDRVAVLDDASLEDLIQNGIPSRGMPSFDLDRAELIGLVAYLRKLRSPRSSREPREAVSVETPAGEAMEGMVLNRSFEDLQLLTPDGRVRLFRREGDDRYRPVTSEVEWPTYDGTYRGYRYTPLDQIDRGSVPLLAPRWIFTFQETSPLETTPVVKDGLMYVTSGNQCWALDAGSGRPIWHYGRPLTRGLVGNAVNGINRGVAVDESHVYMVTDHAHLLALDRFTGELVWETVMGDWRENYSATAAPMVAARLVISGTAGGDAGARGFLAAYAPDTGREVWRFWTAPAPGKPGSETWVGPAIEHPGAVTWLTGSYDPERETLYWTTGNPGSDLDGGVRLGDNLYSDAVLALDVHTGRLEWYYQFTPHDTW
ncbi:MAG TPA: PQQ-binding-like beta-propeller repeat protein, partial [Longimicrobiales bacterium]|nr:PQQ-binding-like beta-propeller repeat protein [Longimicrobiales bacterium]